MKRSINDITHDFIAHLTKRDINNLTDLFLDTVDWFIPGDSSRAPWVGQRFTKNQVEDFFNVLWKNTEPLSAHIYEILFNEQSAIIAGEFSTRMLSTNKVVNSIFFIHITEKNGYICRYRLLEDSFCVSESLTHHSDE